MICLINWLTVSDRESRLALYKSEWEDIIINLIINLYNKQTWWQQTQVLLHRFVSQKNLEVTKQLSILLTSCVDLIRTVKWICLLYWTGRWKQYVPLECVLRGSWRHHLWGKSTKSHFANQLWFFWVQGGYFKAQM